MTARDREIVRWIGRLRMATAGEVAERFGLGRAVSYARLNGLVRLSLLEHARIFHASPGVYLATHVGLASVDLALPPSRVDLRTYEHDLELSTLVVELEREFGAERIATEREMRAADTPVGQAPVEQPRFAVPLAGARAAEIAAVEATADGPAQVRAWVSMQARRNPRVASLARTLDQSRHGDDPATAAWRDRTANRMRRATAVVQRLRREGRVHRSWTTAQAATLVWELVSFRAWDAS